MITTKEIAWAAGFLEGEGCFRVNFKKKSPGYRGLRIQANQVQKEPLERLQRIFGGNINYVPAKPYKNAIWDWSCNGPLAVGVMFTIFDFMSPKRKAKIKECIASWKSGRTAHGPAKKFCKSGHPWTKENINIRTYKGSTIKSCKPCSIPHKEAYFAALKEKRLEAKLAGLPQPHSFRSIS